MDESVAWMGKWIGMHKKWLRNGALFLCAAAVLFYGICYMLTFKAAELFNETVRERQLFPGTVTVSRISADFLGHVSFENLRWVNADGVLLADIPAGGFDVKPWDIVTGHIGTMTVTRIEVDEGYLHLFFDDRMQVRYLKPRRADQKDPTRPIRLTGTEGNRRFHCVVVFKNGTIEAESPDRHFKMEHVNLNLNADTAKKLAIDLSTGPFSGTIGAEGLRMGGTVDLTGRVPVYDMFLSVKDLRPSTLGVGVDIDNPANAEARIRGELPRPVIDGKLSLDQLDLPGIQFTDVAGNFHYEDGKLDAPDVTAHAFGGDVAASGKFDLDNASYEAVIHGDNLKGGIAARDLGLRCDVTLDLTMRKAGREEEQEIDGKFSSGNGRYHILPFKGISGTFDRRDGVLSFHDVVISLAMGDVTTDAFRIVDGKVEIGPVYLRDALSGHTERVR